DRDRRIARGAPCSAVADRLALRNLADRDHRALERHYGLKAEVRCLLISEWGHTVEREARTHPVRGVACSAQQTCGIRDASRVVELADHGVEAGDLLAIGGVVAIVRASEMREHANFERLRHDRTHTRERHREVGWPEAQTVHPRVDLQPDDEAMRPRECLE